MKELSSSMEIAMAMVNERRKVSEKHQHLKAPMDQLTIRDGGTALCCLEIRF